MYEIILKDGLGRILAEDAVDEGISLRTKIKLNKKIVIYDKEFNDIEWLTIPKNIVDKITALKGQ